MPVIQLRREHIHILVLRGHGYEEQDVEITFSRQHDVHHLIQQHDLLGSQFYKK